MQGYSLPEILSGVYQSESHYPAPRLDWSQTRKVNGKTVSDLRKRVRERLTAQGGDEYDGATIAKTTVDKYKQVKDKQYQEYWRRQEKLDFEALKNF